MISLRGVSRLVYKDCKDCIAKPFCKIYKGEVKRKPYPDWCNAKFRLYKALELSKIPKEYINANIYNYDVDDNNKNVFEKIKKYVDDIVSFVENGYNLYIYGNNFGIGKTFTAAVLLNHYIYKICLTDKFDFENPPALFVSHPELIVSLRNFESEETEIILNEVKSVPLLLLDDIGEGIIREYAREQTYLLLNYRFNNNLSTIITTNYPPKQLAEILGESCVSRILHNCGGLSLKGEDKRRKRLNV